MDKYRSYWSWVLEDNTMAGTKWLLKDKKEKNDDNLLTSKEQVLMGEFWTWTRTDLDESLSRYHLELHVSHWDPQRGITCVNKSLWLRPSQTTANSCPTVMNWLSLDMSREGQDVSKPLVRGPSIQRIMWAWRLHGSCSHLLHYHRLRTEDCHYHPVRLQHYQRSNRNVFQLRACNSYHSRVGYPST